MKSLTHIIFLGPLLLFLILLLVNFELLRIESNISLFGLLKFENINIIPAITGFFIIYIVLIWALLKFSNIFSSLRDKRKDQEINKLKSRLLDGQEELIEKYKDENFLNIQKLKKENEKILSNLEFKIDKLEKVLTVKKEK